MLSKKQILSKIRYLKKTGAKFCVAIKTVIGAGEEKNPNGEELRLVPLLLESADQFDYTMRFCRVMINADGREVVPFSSDKLGYIDIIGANSEEEGNKKIKGIITAYSKHNGYGKVMSEEELVQTASECMTEVSAEA